MWFYELIVDVSVAIQLHPGFHLFYIHQNYLRKSITTQQPVCIKAIYWHKWVVAGCRIKLWPNHSDLCRDRRTVVIISLSISIIVWKCHQIQVSWIIHGWCVLGFFMWRSGGHGFWRHIFSSNWNVLLRCSSIAVCMSARFGTVGFHVFGDYHNACRV